jgi:hypothetical protein
MSQSLFISKICSGKLAIQIAIENIIVEKVHNMPVRILAILIRVR